MKKEKADQYTIVGAIVALAIFFGAEEGLMAAGFTLLLCGIIWAIYRRKDAKPIFIPVIIGVCGIAVIGGTYGITDKESVEQATPAQSPQVEQAQQPEQESTPPIAESNTQQVDADEQYRNKLRENSELMSNGLTKFSDLLSSYDGTDEWKLNTATVMAALRMVIDDARKITPTENYKEAHAKYMLALGEIDKSLIVTADAVDKNDPALVKNIIKHMERGGRYIEEANSMIK